LRERFEQKDFRSGFSVPPTVQNCPNDITKTTNGFGEVITWTEHKFTDNVGIRHMMQSIRKPGEVWSVCEEMRTMYTAILI